MHLKQMKSKHKQNKSFTVMVVPYFSGKTRRLTIPFWFPYAAGFFVLAILSSFIIFSLVTNHFKTVAFEKEQSLKSSRQMNAALQQEKAALNSKIQEVEDRSNEKVIEKSQDFDEKVKQYEEKAKELQGKLEELQKAKEDVINQLSEKSFIPEVNKLLASFTPPQEEAEGQLLAMGGPSVQPDLMMTMDDLSRSYDKELVSYTALLEGVKRAKPAMDNYPTIWPVRGQVTSEVGGRANPMGGAGGEYHTGLDIAVPTGTPVKATGGGTVKFSGTMNGYGYIVIISHGNGLESYYGHNSKLLVSAGDKVARGEVIALSGSTGRSTGPHVHYEIRSNGVVKNPRNYLD